MQEKAMGRFSDTKRQSQLGSDPLQRNDSNGPSERSLAASLRAIVRRVLRTNLGRNHFELRILGEARRLLETHCRDLSRDALARLIVDNLLEARGGRRVACTAGEDQIGTQALVTESTFVY
jgi:hypothetical protein